LDRGSQVAAITEALEGLRRRNLLSYSEKQGYKIQSTAGEEWERERRDIGVSTEAIGEMVQGALRHLLGSTDRPRLHARTFPWKAHYSDGDRVSDALLADSRDDATIVIDFRFVGEKERSEGTW